MGPPPPVQLAVMTSPPPILVQQPPLTPLQVPDRTMYSHMAMGYSCSEAGCFAFAHAMKESTVTSSLLRQSALCSLQVCVVDWGKGL